MMLIIGFVGQTSYVGFVAGRTRNNGLSIVMNIPLNYTAGIADEILGTDQGTWIGKIWFCIERICDVSVVSW